MATETLLTAEDYLRLPDLGHPSELVRGVVIPQRFPGVQHGFICATITWLLTEFVDAHDLGHVLSISGIVTARGPDTVRSADVSYYSYARMPKDEVPVGYAPVAPELVFEVTWQDDVWEEVLIKVAEFLDAGVLCVCVVDSEREAAFVHRPGRPQQTFTSDQALAIPDLLSGFILPLPRLFKW
jgi:Uma2 family endonuclease